MEETEKGEEKTTEKTGGEMGRDERTGEETGEEKTTERTGDETGREERTGGETGEEKVGEETKGVVMEGDKSVTPEGSENPKEEDVQKREVSQVCTASHIVFCVCDKKFLPLPPLFSLPSLPPPPSCAFPFLPLSLFPLSSPGLV